MSTKYFFWSVFSYDWFTVVSPPSRFVWFYSSNVCARSVPAQFSYAWSVSSFSVYIASTFLSHCLLVCALYRLFDWGTQVLLWSFATPEDNLEETNKEAVIVIRSDDDGDVEYEVSGMFIGESLQSIGWRGGRRRINSALWPSMLCLAMST